MDKLTVGEIITILTLLVGAISWLAKVGYSAVKQNIADPLVKSLDDLSKSLAHESKWIHDRHSEVIKTLDDHENKLEDHGFRLTKQETKLEHLEKEKKS